MIKINKEISPIKCKKCGMDMERRSHRKITHNNDYYEYWDVCPKYSGGCGSIWLYEEAKRKSGKSLTLL